MKEAIFVFVFFLPAGIANMMPVFVSKLPGLRYWNTPMDFGKSWRGHRIFGDHKTVRGFLFGILAAVAITLVISYLSPNYLPRNPIVLGTLLGAGALIGDATKSFFKRRAGLPEGKTWFPYDQTDYILGAIIFSYFYAPLRPVEYLIMLALGFILHLIIVYIGYLTHIRESAF